MRQAVQVKIGRRKISIPAGRAIGRGCQRSAYNTDFTFRGRRFIVKRANNKAGICTNRIEYLMYKHGKQYGYNRFMPIVLGVSRCGTWLLMERCIPRNKALKGFWGEVKPEYIHLAADPYKIFPSSMHNDLHVGNWGYTEKGMRPVIFDLGYDTGELSDTAMSLGVPRDTVDALLGRRPECHIQIQRL